MSDTSTLLPKENIDPTTTEFWSKVPFNVVKWCITTLRADDPRRRRRRRGRSRDDGDERKHLRLVAIGPSHFCEKARWALDLAQNDSSSPYYNYNFTEDDHPPLFQSVFALDASDGESSAVPMVVVDNDDDDGARRRLWCDSKEICREVRPGLYPESRREEIERWENDLGTRLGATARCLVYDVLLRPEHHGCLVRLATVRTSWIERLLWNRFLLAHGLADGLRSAMDVNETTAARSREEVRRVFDEVSERLAKQDGDARRHLLDTETEEVGFTAADLTFCALASVLLRPPELSPFFPEHDDVPEELASLCRELSSTTAGRYALRTYARYRRVRGGSLVVSKNDRRAGRPTTPVVLGVGTVLALAASYFAVRFVRD